MVDEGTPPRTTAEELARELDRLREQAGVPRAALGREVGFSQTKASRIFGGNVLPAVADVERILDFLHVHGDPRQQALALARDAAEEADKVIPTRVLLQTGVNNLQRRIRRRENAATHVAAFHPAIVPGLLQSEAYMRFIALSGGDDPDSAKGREWLRVRRGRQTDREHQSSHFILTTATLSQPISAPLVVAEQCDHIAHLTDTRPQWRIGIIPAVLPSGETWLYPQNGFDLYDNRVVAVGTTAGEALTANSDVVEKHIRLLARLEALAVYGDEARTVLSAIATDYRTRGE